MGEISDFIPVPVGWIRLLASSRILLTASIDSKRIYKSLKDSILTLQLQINFRKEIDRFRQQKKTSNFKSTFQSGLSKPLRRLGVILVLISSLGKLSNPPEDVDVETDVLTTLFGAAVP